MCDELLDSIVDDIDARITVFDPDFAYQLIRTEIAFFETPLLYVVAIVNQEKQISFYIAEKSWLRDPDMVYINVKIKMREYLLRVADFIDEHFSFDRPKRTTLIKYKKC